MSQSVSVSPSPSSPPSSITSDLGGHSFCNNRDDRSYVPGHLDGYIPIDGDEVIHDALHARRKWQLPSVVAVWTFGRGFSSCVPSPTRNHGVYVGQSRGHQ